MICANGKPCICTLNIIYQLKWINSIRLCFSFFLLSAVWFVVAEVPANADGYEGKAEDGVSDGAPDTGARRSSYI